jgi:hypothetical protein
VIPVRGFVYGVVRHSMRGLTVPRTVRKLLVRRIRATRPAKGTASGAVTLCKRAKAERFAIATTLFAEAERLAREGRKVFLGARIKTGSTLWRGPAKGEQSRPTKVGPRCRKRNRRWRTATKKTT